MQAGWDAPTWSSTQLDDMQLGVDLPIHQGLLGKADHAAALQQEASNFQKPAVPSTHLRGMEDKG